MLTLLVISAVFFGVGFGAGRVKDKAKLAAIKAEIAKVEASASEEVSKLFSAIKNKL